MDQPALSEGQLSQLLTSALSPSELYDKLSSYEDDAYMLFTGNQIHGDPKLLSAFYASFFVAHLLTDQVPAARSLTQRMPPSLLQTDVALQNCLNLLRAVWQCKHAQVYKILRELPWPAPVNTIVQRYDVYFQEKALKEVSRAFEAIRPAAAAEYLGLDTTLAEQHDPSVIDIFVSYGWRWDSEANLLYPEPVPGLPQSIDSTKELRDITALISSHVS
ncbi:hypothetical protein ASPZODRAFT_98019 [Penicilliopsis zonata CBS 506.65]|uniref:CSN8/PSMD8/EIF3K domain-containing protein n=1 Tax=Penicilliopsis zonata CBS 506.65 TaxID=1073090 RepID=A0A1L9SGQ1_9EURO|nr:hypothetical protein ASPZODRAFT_98019 [Penicilliopsis zonata CBS 506.65]OJJ46267.1 hypothetical protein ASPZODRAFT_98019 [Penicilliopsis zonata CBS 506.65]